MKYHVVIVESPTKAKTISKFLNKEYKVIASIGHIRDLPKSVNDIPQKYKGAHWARLGINVDDNFTPIYTTIKGKGKIVNEIKRELKDADSLILATDEDREGESIAHHIIEAIKPKVPIKRMVFHEITQSAIQNALQECRDIHYDLVEAQETRRILDRLFGFKLSELLWKKITYKISAGRVQSPGLRLLVERERERSVFKQVHYADIHLTFAHNDNNFNAVLTHWDNKQIAIGADFNQQGILTKKEYLHLSETDAKKIEEKLQNYQFSITKIEEKPQKINPPIPFITSTLQQDSNRKLHLSARDTMRIAQTLYERGFITYMRTDSPSLSSQAIQATRNYISKNFDKKYLPEKPRIITSKNKNAQEAHEAIRPSGTEFMTPHETKLTGKERDLYSMIWERTIASQMNPAEKSITSICIQSVSSPTLAECRSSGSVLTFPGFLAIYTQQKTEEKFLPSDLKEKQSLIPLSTISAMHQTKPPSRYNDASLVKILESLSIGRPSTYASIINTLIDRGYVKRVDKSLMPTLMGFAVIQFLEKNFNDYVDYNFTAAMEKTLDKIAQGEEDKVQYLNTFYFGDNGLVNRVSAGAELIDNDESRIVHLSKLDKKYEVRIGKYGPFILLKSENDETENVTIPEDCNPSEITEEYINKLIEIKRKGPQSIGKDPQTGKNVYCLTGRYGPYVQLGEITEDVPKPHRSQLPKDINMTNVTLEEALKLLSLPKILGVHPETGENIIAKKGPFGPYIESGETRRSLRKDDSDIYEITLSEALQVLTRELKYSRTSRLFKTLGEHKKKKVALYHGQYGIYAKIGKKNIALSNEQKTESVANTLTLKDIIKIISQ